MKTQDNLPFEQEKKRRYKKRYILRMLEQQEAQQEIQKFDRGDPPKTTSEYTYKQGKEK